MAELKHYTLEQAINDASRLYSLDMKDAYDMDQQELMAARDEILKYVRFVPHKGYAEPVAQDRRTGLLVTDLQDLREEPLQGTMPRSSFYVPVRTAAADRQHLHECANCGHTINTYGMTDLRDYYVCPGCGCRMLACVDHALASRGLAKGSPEARALSEAARLMLKSPDMLELVLEAARGIDHEYQNDKGGLRFNEP